MQRRRQLANEAPGNVLHKTNGYLGGAPPFATTEGQRRNSRVLPPDLPPKFR